MLQSGSLLKERYEIQSVLGEGGMGFVYLAHDRVLGGKRVAVKEMAVHIRRADEKEQALRQFRDEAHLLASLEHPRLVPVTDFFEDGDNAYLVMSYVDGCTLDEVGEKRPVSMREVLDWIDQICDVLEYLHGHQPPVLFRDLKPSNVMLDSRNQIRLIDFGIARTLETGQSTNTFLKGAGTAEFAPLEQFGGRGTDARSDIYSLGATLYNLLTGALPPISVDIISGEAEAPDPLAHNPAIPPALACVMLKAMALKKEDRFQSVQEMRAELQAACAANIDALTSACAAGAPTVLPSDRPLAPARAPNVTVVAPKPGSNDTAALPSARGATATLAEERPARAALPEATADVIRERPAARRSPLMVVGALIAIILLGMAGRVGYRWLSDARKGQIHVVSSPKGARVILDGSARGQTPLTLADVPGGLHVLNVEKEGMEPLEVPFVVEGPSKIKVRPGYSGTLSESAQGPQIDFKLQPKKGTLLVNVEPARGDVFVDGSMFEPKVPRGKPLSLMEGVHDVEVRLAGYLPLRKKVTVGWKATVDLSGNLRPAVASLAIHSDPSGAVVRLDGRAIGKTPLKNVETGPGDHRLLLGAAGYEDHAARVTVNAGEQRSVDISLRPIPRATPTPQPKQTVTVIDVPAETAPPASYPEQGTPPPPRHGHTSSLPGGNRQPVIPGQTGWYIQPGTPGWQDCQEQMARAMDMVRGEPTRKGWVLGKIKTRLELEGRTMIHKRMAGLKRVLDRGQSCGPREYHRQRAMLAEYMTQIANFR